MAPSRHVLAAAAALAALAPAPTLAQDRTELRLVFHGGAHLGVDTVWRVAGQEVLVLSTQDSAFPTYEAVDLSRAVRPGLWFGVGVEFYPAASLLGLGVEVAFTDHPADDGCRLARPITEFGEPVASMCRYIDEGGGSLGGLALTGGFQVRPPVRWRVMPYLRVHGGVVARPHEPTAVEAPYGLPDQPALPRTLYRPTGTRTAPITTAAVGAAVEVVEGYAVRLEWRALGQAFSVVDGPAGRDAQGRPPIANRWLWRSAVTIGLDIVVARPRIRRY